MWDPTEALSQEGWLAPPIGLFFPILPFLTKQHYGHWFKPECGLQMLSLDLLGLLHFRWTGVSRRQGTLLSALASTL